MAFKRPIILLHKRCSYIYTWRIPLLFLSPCWLPFVPPLCPLLLTWHPPAVTGIVHLSLRLLVNWPHLPHPSPNPPLPSKFPEPQLPSASLRWRREYSGSCYPEQYYIEGKDNTSSQTSQRFFLTVYFGLPRYIPPRPLRGTEVRKHWSAK